MSVKAPKPPFEQGTLSRSNPLSPFLPQSIQIVTKVGVGEEERLRLEEVRLMPPPPVPPIGASASARAANWRAHRKLLEEQMRQKRLRGLEERQRQWALYNNEEAGEGGGEKKRSLDDMDSDDEEFRPNEESEEESEDSEAEEGDDEEEEEEEEEVEEERAGEDFVGAQVTPAGADAALASPACSLPEAPRMLLGR